MRSDVIVHLIDGISLLRSLMTPVKSRILVCHALIIVSCASVFGQLPGNPENWCREGFFTLDAKVFGVGFVKGKKGTRTYFYNDDSEKCPVSASCRSTSYVVPGDTVFTNRTRGEHVCSWFSGANGIAKVGWLRTSDIDFPNMIHDASERVWLGEWRYGTNSISFAKTKIERNLSVKGSALWKGLGDNVHIGELDANAAYKDGVLEYSDGTSEFDCRATMRLAIEQYLIVADNGNCGGANVTFSGIYRKVPAKAPKK